jgi:hypothetical protein
MTPIVSITDWAIEAFLFLVALALLWYPLRNRRKLRWLPLFMLWAVGSAIIGVLGFRLGRTMLRQAEMNKSLDAWHENAPAHYTLTLERQSDAHSPCQQTFDISENAVVVLVEDTCGDVWAHEPLTVDALFDRVRHDLRTKTCGPNGCVCDGVVTLQVIYHETWGYPVSLTTDLQPSHRWLYPEDWITFKAGCTSEVWSSETITVLEVVPQE